MALKYTPRAEFIPLHNRSQRWAAVNTHRRAGKTVALVNDLVFGTLECKLRKPQLAYVGPTYSQAKRVAWSYLKDFAEPYLSRPPQEAELKVTLKNEGTIYVLGADNADALRGMYLDGTVNDEYALFRPSVFSQVIRPALSDRNGWSIFASTPRGKNLFYDVCEQARRNPKEWFNLTLKASTSGIIPLEELEALRRDMDPEEYAQEYECSFDSALKGSIYANEVNLMFDEGRVVHTDLYDENLPVYCAFDLGFTDATVCIWFQIDRELTIRIVAAEATNGVDIFYHIEKLQAFPGEIGKVFLPHDAKAKNLQTGRSIVEQFIKEGIVPTLVPMHKVRDGIAAARRLFPRIQISEPGTGDLVEALKSYRREWNENLSMFSDTPLHDWASDWADAFRYVCLAAELLVRFEPPAIDSTRSKSPVHFMKDFHLEGLHEDNAYRTRLTRIA